MLQHNQTAHAERQRLEAHNGSPTSALDRHLGQSEKRNNTNAPGRRCSSPKPTCIAIAQAHRPNGYWRSVPSRRSYERMRARDESCGGYGGTMREADQRRIGYDRLP